MIEIEGLSVDLGEFKLDDVNLSVGEGEYMVIMGPSGAGKTILLQAILGIARPESGRILVDGMDVTGLPPEKRGLSYVPQNYALFPHMTVYENIAFGLRVRRYEDSYISSRVKEISEVMGIGNLLHRKPSTLSGGEQQRVALARALVVEPKALLLDEPLSALDKITRLELQRFLKRVHSDMKFTAIHVTHDFLEASYLADRMAIMFSGRILRVGTLEDIMAHPGDERVARFIGGENIFRGRIMDSKEGLTRIRIGELEIFSIYSGSGDALVIIRPEDVYVHGTLEIGNISARNIFKGTVEEVEFRDPAYLVTFNVKGIPVKSVVTKQALEELSIVRGKEFTLSVKAAAVKVISS